MIGLKSCPVLNSVPPAKNVLHGRLQSEAGLQNLPNPFSYQWVWKWEITQTFHGTGYILPAEAGRQLCAQIQAQSCILLYSGRSNCNNSTGCFELIPWGWHRRGSCDAATKISHFSGRASRSWSVKRQELLQLHRQPEAAHSAGQAALGNTQTSRIPLVLCPYVSITYACWKQSDLTT